jgi:hypothetical protein
MLSGGGLSGLAQGLQGIFWFNSEQKWFAYFE